ncbi:hypothetical protein B0H12DRAFT_1279602, partial [Mycena haematopus]
QEFQLPTKTIRSAFASNPLDSTSHDVTPPPRTQTVPARDVFHNVQAAIRPLIANIQTREQVTDLIQSLQDLHQRNVNEARNEQIIDPPAISHKGRPRTARITNAREGRQRGGVPGALESSLWFSPLRVVALLRTLLALVELTSAASVGRPDTTGATV